jgi:acetyltransferase-like isoleucine patch superfamily enzyme
MSSRRSVFAKPLIHQAPGAYQPLRLLLIRALRMIMATLGGSVAPMHAESADEAFTRERLGRDGGRLGAFSRRLEMGELWRTDIFAYRVQRARQMGMKIGEGCRLYSLQVASEAELVELGNNVIVSGEVMFVTHDGAVFTARDQFPDVNGHYGRIRIGDGCFLGMRAVIMPGVELGENCIVAAGAVVMDSFAPNSVVAGNPATFVCSRSMYLELKRHHAATVYNHAVPFPLKFPPELLVAHMANVPFKPVRRRDNRGAIAPAGKFRNGGGSPTGNQSANSGSVDISPIEVSKSVELPPS